MNIEVARFIESLRAEITKLEVFLDPYLRGRRAVGARINGRYCDTTEEFIKKLSGEIASLRSCLRGFTV